MCPWSSVADYGTNAVTGALSGSTTGSTKGILPSRRTIGKASGGPWPRGELITASPRGEDAGGTTAGEGEFGLPSRIAFARPHRPGICPFFFVSGWLFSEAGKRKGISEVQKGPYGTLAVQGGTNRPVAQAD